MPVRYVLFDLDGVLVETKQIHYFAFQQAIKLAHLSIDETTHTAIYDGLPTKTKLKNLALEHTLNEETIKKIDLEKQKHTIEMLQSSVTADSEKIALMKHLKDHNIKIAVCSNSRRESLDIVISRLGISKLIDLSLSNDDVTEPKPSPEIYFLAMKHFKAKPSECIIIEDSPHGLTAANASGAQVIKVNNSFEVNIKLFEKYQIWAS
jgi:HAD superfamily hydrolase (TIGR01509 family)